jgi:hypothetical protein
MFVALMKGKAMTVNPFSFDTGIKSDYDGEVTEAAFEQGQSGNWSLKLTFDIDGEEWHQSYSVGKDWSSFDGGETISHPNGDKARINNRTAYADFVACAMGTDAAGEVVKRNEAYGGGNLGLLHAGLWVGLGFHMDALTREGIKRTDAGDWVAGERVLPTKGWVVKEGGDGGVGKGAGTTAASGDSIHPLDLARLVAAAKSSANLGDFADKILAMTTFDGQPAHENATIMDKLGTPGWFEELKG